MLQESHDDQLDVTAAVEAMAAPDSVELLARLAQQGDDEAFRLDCIRALGAVEHFRAVDALAVLARGGDPVYEQAATFRLLFHLTAPRRRDDALERLEDAHLVPYVLVPAVRFRWASTLALGLAIGARQGFNERSRGALEAAAAEDFHRQHTEVAAALHSIPSG